MPVGQKRTLEKRLHIPENISDDNSSDTASENSLSFRHNIAKSGTAATTVSGLLNEKTEDCINTVFGQKYDNEENDNGDTETILTSNQDLVLPPDTKEALISIFAGALYRNMEGIMEAQQKSVESTIGALPNLLREFSMQLIKVATHEHQELATLFVRRYRGSVIFSLINCLRRTFQRVWGLY